MKIEYLSGHKNFIPKLAQWLYSQWSYMNPGDTLKARRERLYKQANKSGIPVSFVALLNDTPVGTASLVHNDLETRPDLKPWAASVYVAPEFRRQGIGAALVSRVVEEAKEQRFPVLYLWTPDRAAFYAKRGWREMERTKFRNEDIVVMSYVLKGSAPLNRGVEKKAPEPAN